MTDEELQARAWTTCCDFHDSPEEIAQHLAEWKEQYGGELNGAAIEAPPGWQLLPYRTVIPNSLHREYYCGVGWLPPRRGISTMTPIWARPAGKTRAFAVPITQPQEVPA